MMWVRVDRGPGRMGFFDNMQDRPIQSGEWKFYEIRGTVDADAISVNYGIMAHGDARVLVDETSLDFSDLPPESGDATAARQAITGQYRIIDRAYSTQRFDELKQAAAPDAKVGSVVMKLPVEAGIAQIGSDLGGASELNVLHDDHIARDQGRRGACAHRIEDVDEENGAAVAWLVSSSDIWTPVDGTWNFREMVATGMREVLQPESPETSQKVAAQVRRHAIVLSGAEAVGCCRARHMRLSAIPKPFDVSSLVRAGGGPGRQCSEDPRQPA